MSYKEKTAGRWKEIRNSKVHHNYFVGERTEAGIVLKGTEIKAIRQGHVQISDAFVHFIGNEPYLHNAHIDEYAFGNINNHEPRRPRKLLLHKREMREMKVTLDMGGHAIIPLRFYFKGGLLKVELAVCEGKKMHDKRETLKKKTEMREAERIVNRHNRR